jgi:two-component system response regulator AtoC
LLLCPLYLYLISLSDLEISVIILEQFLGLVCVTLDNRRQKMMQAKTVLVVDNEETLAYFLGESLAELGPDCLVETARSGEEALDRLAVHPFDLVVTDLHLPGISGLELIRRMRQFYPQTPVILITGSGNGRLQAEAHRLEVREYITKPFPIEYFMRAAQGALQA